MSPRAGGALPAYLPPGTAEIRHRLSSRNVRRARSLVSLLRPVTAWHGRALAALEATLSFQRGTARSEWLLQPDVRAWLCAAEEAAGLSRSDQDEAALFARVSRGSHLAEAAPAGRVDRHFRGRVARLARRLTTRVFDRLPEILLFQTPPDSSYGPFSPDLAPDTEEARAAGELHVSVPAPMTLRIGAETRMHLVAGGVLLTGRGRPPRITPRPCIPGTEIILTRRLVPSRTGRKPGSAVPGLGRRLASALDLLRAAWDEGHREVLAWTRVIVPLFERGTVSYSQPDRPGVSYIRIPGKTLIDLADDLLHETAHHRLHALEETGPLTNDDGEPRYFSPWRRAIRPVRGILHATYTFSYRAQLLARLAHASGRLPRAWIRRELAAERLAITNALALLADAERRGLFTGAGSRLLRSLRDRKPWSRHT